MQFQGMAATGVIRFLHLLATRFIADRGLPNAASLTFTTLLSLVPLMTVGLAIFAAFPISDKVADGLQDFVFKNFVPASGEIVQQHLQEFSSKASRLTGVGFGFLVLVAVMLMSTIDEAINTIWRVRQERKPLAKFLMYWSILSLGPLLIGLSVVVTSYMVSLPIISDTAVTLGLRLRLLAFMPLLAAAVAFTLLYAVVPNRKVPPRHAIAGGVLAALLFELAKRGFAFYVTQFPTYEAIYGALAVVPIFLVWIYLCWVVTLLGAEFAYCLSIFNDEGKHGSAEQGGDLLLAYRLLGELWQAQQSGEAFSPHQLGASLGHVPEERMERLLEQLEQAHMVLQTGSGAWALARDLSRVTLHDLYRVEGFVLPEARLLEGSCDGADQALARILAELGKKLETMMQVPLQTLYQQREIAQPLQPSETESGGESPPVTPGDVDSVQGQSSDSAGIGGRAQRGSELSRDVQIN
ncbi:MAG: virulence factor BrkB family protein [Gammaproteobacteria bacterium]|nr:virulence factor BrkB family protein [Gammaproteobacteria bacterium]